MFVYRLAAIFLLIFSWSGVAAGAQVSGSVSNNYGTALAHITVTLTDDQTTASLIQRTDAFGRYQFSSVSSGTYQVAFADENFTNFIDEDPFPDEGTIHLDAMLPQTITVQENQNLDLGDFALARVDSTPQPQPAPEPQPAPQPQPAPLPNDDTQDTDAGENPVTDDNVNSNTTDETDTESDTTPILSNDFTPGSGGGGGAVGFNLILLALLMLLSTRKRRYDRSF